MKKGFIALALGAFVLGFSYGQEPKIIPTYNSDVAPILAANCMQCHRPGEIAPISLMSYEEVRPWVNSIRSEILARSMPPWHADRRYGAFSNERQLTDEQIQTIVSWVDAGAPHGDPRLPPLIPEFVDGWQIGQPDIVFSMQEEATIPASGPDFNLNFEVFTSFTADVWVIGAELRGNPHVLRHATAVVYDAQGNRDATGRLASAVPGKTYELFMPGSGKLIKAGSKIVLGMHYHPSGKVEKDRTSIGLILGKEPLEWQVFSRAAADVKLVIPPGVDNHVSTAEFVFPADAELTLLKPHMHYRGKDIMYKAIYPNRREEILLFVPKYDMHWQMNYELEQPKPMPKGTKIVVTAHFDNSANNPRNPDANAQVRWGEDFRDEMMEGWFDYRVRLPKPPPRTVGR